MELYNEELSDLIAAADDESSGKLRKLRLLEDPKKGIVLQVLSSGAFCGVYIFISLVPHRGLRSGLSTQRTIFSPS